MKYVYLAGPIFGCTEDEANEWREYVTAKFSRHIVGVSPLRFEPAPPGDRYGSVDDSKLSNAAAINGKNYYDTKTCHLIFAYLPKFLNDRRPSYGTVIEIGWAIGMRKPIILVSDDDYLVNHPLIVMNVGWRVSTLDSGIEIVEGLFSDYLDR